MSYPENNTPTGGKQVEPEAVGPEAAKSGAGSRTPGVAGVVPENASAAGASPEDNRDKNAIAANRAFDCVKRYCGGAMPPEKETTEAIVRGFRELKSFELNFAHAGEPETIGEIVATLALYYLGRRRARRYKCADCGREHRVLSVVSPMDMSGCGDPLAIDLATKEVYNPIHAATNAWIADVLSQEGEQKGRKPW